MLTKCKNAKCGSRAFKRTIYHAIWMKIRWNMQIWKSLNFHHFCIFLAKKIEFCKNAKNARRLNSTYFDEFLSKMHAKLCVWKPLIHTLHFCTLWASTSILRASTGTYMKLSKMPFSWNFRFCHMEMLVLAREMFGDAHKLQKCKVWCKSYSTHFLSNKLDK